MGPKVPSVADRGIPSDPRPSVASMYLVIASIRRQLRRRFRCLALAALSVVLGTTALGALAPGPSHAGTGDDFYLDVYGDGVTVRKGSCRQANVWGYGDWSQLESTTITVTVRKPNGRRLAVRTWADDFSDSIDEYFRVCYRDPAGRYTAQVVVEGIDDLGQTLVATDNASFRVDRVIPKKRSRISERHGRVSGHGAYEFGAVGTLWRSGRKYGGQRVALLVRISGYWYRVDSAVTIRHGRAKGKVGWYFKPNRRKWSFYYRGDARTKRSASDTFQFARSGREAPASTLARVRDLVRPQR